MFLLFRTVPQGGYGIVCFKCTHAYKDKSFALGFSTKSWMWLGVLVRLLFLLLKPMWVSGGMLAVFGGLRSVESVGQKVAHG